MCNREGSADRWCGGAVVLSLGRLCSVYMNQEGVLFQFDDDQGRRASTRTPELHGRIQPRGMCLLPPPPPPPHTHGTYDPHTRLYSRGQK